MTFEEATTLKKSLGKDFIERGGFDMKILVVPMADKDFLRYCDFYRVSDFDDQSSIDYSLNSQYTLMALWTNGANVLHSDPQLNNPNSNLDPVMQYKNQHIIPQVYMKEFGYLHGSQHKISVLERGMNHIANKSIKSFMTEDNFYTFHSISDENDKLLYEKLNGEIETNYEKVINKIKAEIVLNKIEREYLMNIVANFKCRTFGFFAFIDFKFQTKILNDFLHEITINMTLDDRKGFYHLMNTLPIPDKLKLIAVVSSGHMTDALQRFNYVIIKSEEDKAWFTCDNPVIHYSKLDDSFIENSSQFFFPLTKKYCLYLWKDNDDLLKQFIPSFKNEELLNSGNGLNEFIATEIGKNTDRFYLSPAYLEYSTLDK